MSVTNFHRRLHAWYKEHGRKDLPWRNTRDAYAIYISEIMLQQTQVKTVLERYYFQFLKRFPTLTALAKAPEQDVLRAWQGLGYYNRAINLHKAAIQVSGIRHQKSGKMHLFNLSPPIPDTQFLIPELMALPGIGRNTAHAIAAFAYHAPVAVMEANVKRVLCRIFALTQPNEAELWEKAEALLDKTHPFDYNQAMMDIGATLCTKRAPRCNECPANGICKGKSSPQSYPAAKAKKTPPVRKKKIILLRNNKGEYYATPRKTRFLQGLYHFVEIEPSSRRRPGSMSSLSKKTGEDIKSYLKEHKITWIPAFAGMTHVGHVRQQYSHFTLAAELFLITGVKARGKDWHSPCKLAGLPLSMAEQSIIKIINQLK